MMNPGWTSIYETSIPYSAEIIRALLEEAGLDAVVVNKQDSALVSIGKVYVYVRKEDVIKAMYIIEREETNREDLGDE